MKERADFHVHYTDNTAKEIIDKAKSRQVVVLGLVGRAEYSSKIGEYVTYGEEVGVRVIPGVEYKARLDGGSVDIICLDFDPNHPAIINYFAKDNSRQQGINQEVAAKEKEFLETQGFNFDNLTAEDQKEMARLLEGDEADKAIKICRIGVNANQKLLAKLKASYPERWIEVQREHGIKPFYQGDPKRLEAKFLYQMYFADENKPGFQYAIAPYVTEVGKIIEATQKAGGIVLYTPEGKFNLQTWNRLIELGIDGVMAWHGNRIELSRSVIVSARKQGLLILGGGDYDPAKNHWRIGTGDETSSMFISPKRAQELEAYKSKRKLRAA